jgi:hypothetical protein
MKVGHENGREERPFFIGGGIDVTLRRLNLSLPQQMTAAA